ncbi:MAG: ferredoxin [Candidatus Aenigmarchaeota archaeon]|nr:ferredoxin [Candidatus Aenigmarchaeota archaeon]
MKITVDNTCIGCGLCVGICPAVFEMKNGKSVVKAAATDKDFKKSECKEAAEACPVNAIKIA